MKKIILMLAMAGFLSGSYAQNLMVSDVPAPVTKAFHKTHPKVEAVEWSKVGDNYKASYVVDSKGTTAIYAASGKLKETEMEISIASLPTEVIKYINDNYSSEVVKRSEKVTSATGKVVYNVNIKGMDLAFDSNGRYIK